MNIASLVLGIISIVTCCSGYGALVGIPCGIVGIVLANSYKKEVDENNGLCTAGSICSKVGLSIVGVYILIIALIVCAQYM